MSSEQMDTYPPWNFSWVAPGKIAGMACPEDKGNMRFLLKKGINHLITLSTEYMPPILEFPNMKWTVIPVEEFEPPRMEQIIDFIDVCKQAESNGEVIGVHCRQGIGRTGTMLACYLVHFQHLEPRTAIRTLRTNRPGSCETYEQEDIVSGYHDFLKGTLETKCQPVDSQKTNDKGSLHSEDTATSTRMEQMSGDPEDADQLFQDLDFLIGTPIL